MAKAKDSKVKATRRTARKKKEKKAAEYQLMYCGKVSVLGGFINGVWYDVPEDKAIRMADKKSFEVREAKTGEILSRTDIENRKQKREEPSRKERVALRKERQRLEGHGSLKPKGEKLIGNVLHDEDYVPSEVEASDLPQMGFEIKKDEPRMDLKNPRSQRDVGAATGIADTRLSPSEASGLAFNEGQKVGEIAAKFHELKMPPRRA